MTLVDRLQTRLAMCRIAVGQAYKAIARAEKEAHKDKTQVPQALMTRLVDNVNAAKDECYSVEAALCGASKFPPLTKGVY